MTRYAFSATLMVVVLLPLVVTIGTRASAGPSACNREMEQDHLAIADAAAAASKDSTHTGGSSLLTGHWRAADTEGEKKQRLQAIEEVTEDMGRFKRWKARSRLEERTTPPPHLMIEITESSLTIVSEDHTLELELGGAPIEIPGSDGNIQVSAQIEGDLLTVVAIGDNGERRTTYRADETGLAMEVMITGDNLDSALKYITTYTRVDEADQ